MSTPLAISAEGISKVYKLYDRPIDRLKESLHPLGKSFHHPFYALKNVSFTVERGETVGVVGKNGSGKSTLLKIVTGILQPTSGALTVNGRVSALLELGAGFNPELTGIENVFLHGIILGFERSAIEARLDEIIEFADIGEFIHQPVKTYSSGMFVRLAFAVATSIRPEILIVDEALAVGDMFFQAKSSKRMKSLIEDYGTTLLFVSHEMSAVKGLCKRAIYLRDGEMISSGDSGTVCDMYVKDQRERLGLFRASGGASDRSAAASPEMPSNLPLPFLPDNADAFAKRVQRGRQGTGRVRINYADIYDLSGHPLSLSFFGTSLVVRVFLTPSEDLPQIVVGCYIRDLNQVEIMGSNNVYEGVPITDLRAGEMSCCEFTVPNYLKAGTYTIKLLVVDALPTTEFYDLIDDAAVFRAADQPNNPRWALVSPPVEVRHYAVQSSAAA
jgi:ABC-type polysaccharide/polyol phosphate transport system ATPase subunit